MARKGLRRLWVARVRAFERSGQSRQAWCEAHGIGVHSLDAWRYRLRRERRAAAKAATGRRSPQALVPIVVREPGPATPASATAWVELVLAGGVQLRVPSGTEVRWLAALTRELGAC